jgi:hypothetical protein
LKKGVFDSNAEEQGKSNGAIHSALKLSFGVKNCVKVKNERFSLGFTVGQGQTIENILFVTTVIVCL